MTKRIIAITELIILYYDVCDNPINYISDVMKVSEITKQRHGIINNIYTLIYGKYPNGSDIFTLMRVLNNDISGKRLTPEQIIARFKVK